MIITVIVRTNNEERNLERFVKSYHDWVDYILIQDDNSDNINYLIDVAEKYPAKVRLGYYSGMRIQCGDVSRAYQDVQLNQLVDWADEINSDWIIMDDCDCFPNYLMKQGARKILEDCKVNFVDATRVYFYKDTKHFSEFAKPGGDWATSLWAWRAKRGFRFIHNGVGGQKFERKDRDKIQKLEIPYALLHHPWPNDEVIAIKRKRYSAIYGGAYSNFNPLKFAGKLENLEEWMRE